MSDFDDFKQTYFDECSELLNELEEQFAEIEAGDRSTERLNAVFRAIHSIKGGAGAFGFTRLVGFAHAYETLLDKVREGSVALSAESLKAFDCVLLATDHDKFDYDLIGAHAPLLVDCRGKFRDGAPHIVKA